MLRRVSVLALLAASSFLTGCSNEEFTGLGFKGNVTSVNESSFGLWQGAWLAAAIVGALTLVLILWPAIFHRKKDDG
ncbi:MAG: cytochrome c oxidase subunit, partial [Actinomycetota bacterium]